MSVTHVSLFLFFVIYHILLRICYDDLGVISVLSIGIACMGMSWYVRSHWFLRRAPQMMFDLPLVRWLGASRLAEEACGLAEDEDLLKNIPHHETQ